MASSSNFQGSYNTPTYNSHAVLDPQGPIPITTEIRVPWGGHSTHLNQYRVHKADELGKGKRGAVYLGQDQNTGLQVVRDNPLFVPCSERH